MKSPRKPEIPTQRWNRAAGVLLALYVLNVIIFAASMLAPDLIERIGLGEYRNSRSWWPILVQVVLGLGAFGCYYWPRARTSRNFSVLVTGVLAATTIFLGLVSYSTCKSTDYQSPLWTPLTFALNLIGGNVAECEPGANTFPPALQLTRLLGPLLLVIAALGIVTSLFRNQYDRIRVRYSAALVLLVGLTDEAMPLLRRLSVDRESGTTLAVLVEDSGNPLIKTARDQGARVVLVDLDQTEILARLADLAPLVQDQELLRGLARRRGEPAVGRATARGRRLLRTDPWRHAAADGGADRRSLAGRVLAADQCLPDGQGQVGPLDE